MLDASVLETDDKPAASEPDLNNYNNQKHTTGTRRVEKKNETKILLICFSIFGITTI